MTTTNGVLLSRLMSDGSDGFDLSPTDTEELQSFTFREIPTVIISSENILARIDRGLLEQKAHPGSIKPARIQYSLSRPQRGHLSVG
ncbi:hypothetical protein CUMW_218120, partial [Citrus unshiu]